MLCRCTSTRSQPCMHGLTVVSQKQAQLVARGHRWLSLSAIQYTLHTSPPSLCTLQRPLLPAAVRYCPLLRATACYCPLPSVTSSTAGPLRCGLSACLPAALQWGQAGAAPGSSHSCSTCAGPGRSQAMKLSRAVSAMVQHQRRGDAVHPWKAGSMAIARWLCT